MPLSISVKHYADKAPLAALALVLLMSLSCGKRKPPLPPEERVLQRAVDRITLGRPEFFQVGVDPLAGGVATLAVVQVPRDVIAGQNSLGDLVDHQVGRLYHR